MKQVKKRILSLLLAFTMLISLAPLSASANSGTITIDGTVQYSRAFDLLDSINELRAEKGLSPFVMDQGMLDAAVIRSAELAVRYSLMRPNGDVFYTAYPEQGGYTAHEITSYDYSNERWTRDYKDNEYVLSSTHQSVGISFFKHNGKDYGLVFFSILEGTPAQRPEDRVITQEINLGNNVYTVTLLGESTMEAGTQQELTVRQRNDVTSRIRPYAIWNNDSLSWTSSNPAVATVHDGVVAALSAGTTEITAQAGGNTASITVTVVGEAVHVHSMKYIEPIAPTYYENGREGYWLCTLCDRMYREEAAFTEVTLDALVIPKLVCSEHVWGDGTVTRAATSTREGNVLYVCVNCSAERNDPIPVNGKTAMHSGDLARAKPSVAQLTERINAITDTRTRFVEEPSVYAPYQAGSLTDAFQNSGLTYLNFIRYMAGLPEVYLDADWSENAQYGAVVLGAIDELTHYPKQPADMDDAFFEEGAEATASSNLSVRGGSGFYSYNVLQSSIRGCMDDCVSLDNLSGVGHRRWLLSPTLEKVGFGAAISRIKDHYAATKVFDKDEPYKEPSFDYNFISWPVSGNMSTNVFNNKVPWSITLNPEVYSTYTKNDLKVTLTCVEGNKVWTFDGNTPGPTTNENQYMIVNGEGYDDVASTIIFAPGSKNIDQYEGTYLVFVEGLKYKDGSPADLYYEVDFTFLDKCNHSLEIIPEVAATCTSTGLTEGSKCKHCGEIMDRQQETPKLEHNFVDGKCEVCGADTSDVPVATPTPDVSVTPTPTPTPVVTPIPTPTPTPTPNVPTELTVTRIAGAGRSDTALQAADVLKAELGAQKFDSIIIASGLNFADALAGSYLAAVKSAPILLYSKGTSVEDNENYIMENLSSDGTVYILGGGAAVPDEVESRLEDLGITVERLYGMSRYDTNLAILEEAGVASDSEILVATATNFADSLSASATGKPILLVNGKGNNLSKDQKDYLAQYGGGQITILGGSGAVSDSIAAELEQYGTVRRLAGQSRYETSTLIAKTYFDTVDTVVIAYGGNFPDGLSGGPVAYAKNAPLILTASKSEAAAAEYVADNSVMEGYIMGGTGALSEETVNKIFAKENKY